MRTKSAPVKEVGIICDTFNQHKTVETNIPIMNVNYNVNHYLVFPVTMDGPECDCRYGFLTSTQIKHGTLAEGWTIKVKADGHVTMAGVLNAMKS
jgi:hypothetical protein